jgi:hypothetical protein
MKTIKHTADAKVQQLTKKDVVVLWGGSNDIAKNNSLVGLKHNKIPNRDQSHKCDSADCPTPT